MISILPGGDCLEKLVDNAVVPGQHCCWDRVSILWLRDLNAVGERGVTTQLMSSFETILRNHVSVLWAVLRLENIARNSLTSDLLYVEADVFFFFNSNTWKSHCTSLSQIIWFYIRIYITDSFLSSSTAWLHARWSWLQTCRRRSWIFFWAFRVAGFGTLAGVANTAGNHLHVVVKGGEEKKLDSRFFARLLWFFDFNCRFNIFNGVTSVRLPLHLILCFVDRKLTDVSAAALGKALQRLKHLHRLLFHNSS